MQKQIQYRQSKIYYEVEGSGMPVMLVHGFGEDGKIWKDQVDFLKNHFKLIIPDLPGSGKSGRIDDMSMESMAEVLKKILDEETAGPHPSLLTTGKRTTGEESEMRRSVLIGHSMGGYITLAFADKYKHLLNGFGLFHSTAYADNEEKIATRKKAMEFMNVHGAFEFLKTSIPNLYSNQTKQQNSTLIEDHISHVNYFADAALIDYYQSMIQRTDKTNLLQQLQIPILFILGNHDTAVPMRDGLKLCHLPDLSYIHILEDSGHMGMLEEPDKSNAILFNYLHDIDNHRLK
jgi:pimeloyl-ACP methyl ester carboxylesterase